MRDPQTADVVGHLRLVGEMRRVLRAARALLDVLQGTEHDVPHACRRCSIGQLEAQHPLIVAPRHRWRRHQERASRSLERLRQRIRTPMGINLPQFCTGFLKLQRLGRILPARQRPYPETLALHQ